MLLRRILHELESAEGPVDLNDLSRTLGVERSALDGMISYLIDKGRLAETSAAAIVGWCDSYECAASCRGAQSCQLITKLPRSYHLVSHDD